MRESPNNTVFCPNSGDLVFKPIVYGCHYAGNVYIYDCVLVCLLISFSLPTFYRIFGLLCAPTTSPQRVRNVPLAKTEQKLSTHQCPYCGVVHIPAVKPYGEHNLCKPPPQQTTNSVFFCMSLGHRSQAPGFPTHPGSACQYRAGFRWKHSTGEKRNKHIHTHTHVRMFAGNWTLLDTCTVQRTGRTQPTLGFGTG